MRAPVWPPAVLLLLALGAAAWLHCTLVAGSPAARARWGGHASLFEPLLNLDDGKVVPTYMGLTEHDPATMTSTTASSFVRPAPRWEAAPGEAGQQVRASVVLKWVAGRGAAAAADDFHYYTADLDLGSPAQSRSFVVQTISSPLLVFTMNACSSRSSCFNSSASATFRACASCRQPYRYCQLYTDVANFSSAPHILAQSQARLCLASYSLPAYQYPEGVAGSLGLGYLYDTGTGPVASFFPPGWPRVVALDLQADRGASYLHMGGYKTNASSAEPVQWGEVQTHGILYHWFPVHSLSLCGAELLAEGTGMAILTLDSPCLGLPRLLYHRVMAWLAADCDTRTGRCYFNHSSAAATHQIPQLYMRLSHRGQPVHLRLSDLLLPSEGGRSRYCIEDLTHDEQALHLLGQPIIYLGTRVVESFITVLDYDQRRVGLANKRPSGPRQDESCPARAECAERQTYDAASNSCLDPPCSDYWLHYTDSDSKECRYHTWVQIVVACVVGLVCAAEMLLSLRFQRLHQRIAATHADLSTEELQRCFA